MRLIDGSFLEDRCKRQMNDEWNKKAAPSSWADAYEQFLTDIENAPTVDAVPVVLCKNCRHRPTKPEKYRDGFDLEFPDGACPCKCEDPFYSWYPFDDWFCPRGERKGGTSDGVSD